MTLANTALLRISHWMNGKKLSLAPEKTEAVLLTKKRKINTVVFNVQDAMVRPKNSIKYLGVYLDQKLSFAVHISKTIEKAGRTVTALSRLMPNVGGPRTSKRRILSSVVHSQILYGAPAWHEATKNKILMTKLSSLQRVLSIRICSGYRTISTQGVGVIAGIPPIKLLIEERRERYLGTPKTIANTKLMRKWQEEWENGKYGRWTYHLIPNIAAWIERPYGDADYLLTQTLSGHGCFNKYLYERKKSTTSNCRYCQKEDDVKHTMFECPNWSIARETYLQKTGMLFTAENMMRSLVESKEGWNHAYMAIRTIMATKESDHRSHV